MAVDRNGTTVVAGQVYLVAGPVRRIDGDTVVIVLDSGDVVRAAAADICKVDDALAGGGGGVTAHSALTGLAADDHTQYVLANGTRGFTGAVLGVDSATAGTLTTRGYVDGQISTLSFFALANFQPLDATLTAIAGLTTSAGQLTKWTGSDTCAQITLGATGESLIAAATQSAARSTLGLATVAATGLASDLTGTLGAAQMPALTGDVTTAAGTVATTLSNSGVTAGTYTLATVTVDAKGRVTSASSGSASGSDILYSDTPNNTVNVASVTAVDVMSKTLSGIAVGDTIEVELWGVMRNDSAAARTYTPSMVLSGGGGANLLTLTCLDGLALTNVAGASRCEWRLNGRFTITSTSAAQGVMESDRPTAAVAAGTAGSIAATTARRVWNTTSSNMTGSGNISVRFASNNAAATQEFTVYGYKVLKRAKVV